MRTGQERALIPTSVVITERLLERTAGAPNHVRENRAYQELARQVTGHPDELLQRLVALAMEDCDAASAGVSVLEGDKFRWVGLQGTLSAFEGDTTPRHFSPCGVCIDQGGAVLMERPERVYDWIASAGLSIPEVLLVPLMLKENEPLGTLWLVAREGRTFDSGHARTLSDLAGFTGRTLQLILAEERLKRALDLQETLTREMSHRVKNLFAVVEGLVRMTAQSTNTKEDFAEHLSGRIRALALADGLVRRHVNETAGACVMTFDEVVAAVLRPYCDPVMSGPPVPIGERAVNDVALILHELATNAAKYGALSAEGGSLSVVWRIEDGIIALTWSELGGPEVSAPQGLGFGSKLIASTVAGHGGTIEMDWARTGLVAHVRLPVEALA